MKQGENRYAFHRGTAAIGFDPPQTFGNNPAQVADPSAGGNALRRRVTLPPGAKPLSGKVLGKEQYFQNIDESNKRLQQQQIDAWDEKRRGNSKGVEAGKAFSK